MTQELLKQLKDAGYSIKYNEAKHALEKPYDSKWEDTKYLGYDEPTLSELIEAVRENKDHYFSLDYNDAWSVYEESVENRWSARYYPDSPVGFCQENGKTPEEAVANLWLVLNS